MRVGFPGGPRLEWYDRNPIVNHEEYFSGPIAPHAITQRWTYTVPTGKKAFLEMAACLVHRRTAATTPGWVSAELEYQPYGVGAGYLLNSFFVTNNIGDKEREALGHAGVMLAGDALRGKTSDLSEGGSCDYLIISKIMEFDA